MDAKEFITVNCKRIETFANGKKFSKEKGYEVMILGRQEKFERLDNTVWVTNPNGKDPNELFPKKIELENLDNVKKSTLRSKIRFLENFLMTCKGNKSNIRVVPFEKTRKQKKEQEFEELTNSTKDVFS